jgi:hypothetical protein
VNADHIIPLGERHLRAVLREYVDYYNTTRSHRTLELETPAGPRPMQSHGGVVAHPVLNGLHHRYEREAASCDGILWVRKVDRVFLPHRSV